MPTPRVILIGGAPGVGKTTLGRALADAILDLAGDKQTRDSLAAAGLAYVDRHGWDAKRHLYFNLIDRLTAESFSGYKTLPAPQPLSGQPEL